jgi:cytoskeletal protein CcmA (bactofilin family)
MLNRSRCWDAVCAWKIWKIPCLYGDFNRKVMENPRKIVQHSWRMNGEKNSEKIIELNGQFNGKIIELNGGLSKDMFH